jgi:hypothetical protein
MSNRYYCHPCALRLGLIVTGLSNAPDLTGTNYQLSKFIKHTAPTGYDGLLSIFDQPDYTQYQDFTVNTSLSGCCQVDVQGRTNLVWYAGRHVGMTFENGRYFCPNDAIKVVLHDTHTHIHSFPVNYEQLYIHRCTECDTMILA